MNVKLEINGHCLTYDIPGTDCENCAKLTARNARLAEQIADLKTEVEETRAELAAERKRVRSHA